MLYYKKTGKYGNDRLKSLILGKFHLHTVNEKMRDDKFVPKNIFFVLISRKAYVQHTMSNLSVNGSKNFKKEILETF
jgi:hypothetical protein